MEIKTLQKCQPSERKNETNRDFIDFFPLQTLENFQEFEKIVYKNNFKKMW